MYVHPALLLPKACMSKVPAHVFFEFHQQVYSPLNFFWIASKQLIHIAEENIHKTIKYSLIYHLLNFNAFAYVIMGLNMFTFFHKNL